MYRNALRFAAVTLLLAATSAAGSAQPTADPQDCGFCLGLKVWDYDVFDGRRGGYCWNLACWPGHTFCCRVITPP